MITLTIANLKMLARNRQATFWALFFPLLLVVVFGLIDINVVGAGSMVLTGETEGARSQALWQKLEKTYPMISRDISAAAITLSPMPSLNRKPRREVSAYVV